MRCTDMMMLCRGARPNGASTDCRGWSGSELRERFDRQMEKLNTAIDERRDVEHQVEVTLRGIAVLEAVAIERGAEPLTGEYIETPMPDGKVLITRNKLGRGKVRKKTAIWSCIVPKRLHRSSPACRIRSR